MRPRARLRIRPGRSTIVLAVGLVLMAGLSFGCRPPVQGNGMNVLFISIETTRADHLGAYGYERDTSPNLDALAAQGTLFESMSVVSPRTSPSLASLLTAGHPHDHGVRNLLMPLERPNTSIAELLRGAGYETGAVQTHARLVKHSGFEQGFDDYDDDWKSHQLAPQVGEKALKWLGERDGERPWFLWLHYYDPHWTYDPPPGPWRTRYGPEDPRPTQAYREWADETRTMGSMVFQNQMPPDEVQAFVNLYDSEIRFTDRFIGMLIAELEARGQMDNTLIVITSDHGESLGEHDYFFEHGDLGTEPEIHVPTFFVAPDGMGVPRGARIPWSVSNIDIAPTVMTLLGLPVDESWVGRSLTEFMDDPGWGDHRAVFGETGGNWFAENDRRLVDGVAGKWRWVRQGRFKLLHMPVPPEKDCEVGQKSGNACRVLYDLDEDPGELEDATERYPDEASRLGGILDNWLARDTGEHVDYRITEEAKEQLRALGYL